MKHTKFFTIVEDDPRGETVTVTPSEYLRRLQPHEAIARLKAHIKSLEDDLRQYSQGGTDDDLGVPENLEEGTQVDT